MTLSPVCGQEEGTGPGPPAALASGQRVTAASTAPGTCGGHGGPSRFQVPEKVPQNLSTKRDPGAVSVLTLPQQFFSPCPFQYRGTFNTSTHVPTRPRRHSRVLQWAPRFHPRCKECSTQKMCFFSTFSMLFGSSREPGQRKSKTVKEEKADRQAGASVKQGLVFAPRWDAPNGVGGSDAGGGFAGSPSRRPRTQVMANSSHRIAWIWHTALPEAAGARPAAGLLRTSIAHPTLRSRGMPSKVPTGCCSNPQFSMWGSDPRLQAPQADPHRRAERRSPESAPTAKASSSLNPCHMNDASSNKARYHNINNIYFQAKLQPGLLIPVIKANGSSVIIFASLEPNVCVLKPRIIFFFIAASREGGGSG